MKWLSLKYYVFLSYVLLQSTTVYTSPLINDQALNSAKDAFIIQSGLAKITQQIGEYYQQRAMTYVRRYSLESEVAVIGFGYKVYKNRSFSFRLKGKTFSLTPDFVNKTYSMGISWSW